MTNTFLRALMISMLIFGVAFTVGCSSDDNNSSSNNPIDPNVEVITATKDGNGFNYKVFYQEEVSAQTRRGIIILAVGDGGTANDGTLNAQCDALARKGYVAITTTYRTNSDYYAGFKADMELIIANETATFDIAKSKVVLGGLSRGGNRLHGAVLPENPEYNSYPIEGIKGVILECAGGDYWKGRGILYPVLFMNNKIDNTVQTPDADEFVNGLQENINPGVKDKSHCLIVSGSGHCTNSGQYRNFILQHIDSWF